jgi:hypothetical protein
MYDTMLYPPLPFLVLPFLMPIESLAHLGANFSFATAILLVLFFFLGLGFGAVMQKTNSIVGALLFHAGVDIPVMIMTFSVL